MDAARPVKLLTHLAYTPAEPRSDLTDSSCRIGPLLTCVWLLLDEGHSRGSGGNFENKIWIVDTIQVPHLCSGVNSSGYLRTEYMR